MPVDVKRIITFPVVIVITDTLRAQAGVVGGHRNKNNREAGVRDLVADKDESLRIDEDGALGEILVAQCLNLCYDHETTRVKPYDLILPSGFTADVKTTTRVDGTMWVAPPRQYQHENDLYIQVVLPDGLTGDEAVITGYRRSSEVFQTRFWVMHQGRELYAVPPNRLAKDLPLFDEPPFQNDAIGDGVLNPGFDAVTPTTKPISRAQILITAMCASKCTQKKRPDTTEYDYYKEHNKFWDRGPDGPLEILEQVKRFWNNYPGRTPLTYAKKKRALSEGARHYVGTGQPAYRKPNKGDPSVCRPLSAKKRAWWEATLDPTLDPTMKPDA